MRFDVGLWLQYLGGYERFYMMLDSIAPFDPVNNPMLNPASVLAIEGVASLSGNTITWLTGFGLKPTDGDVLYAGLSDGSKNLLPIPPELTSQGTLLCRKLIWLFLPTFRNPWRIALGAKRLD